jgi:hypothetical protein
MTLVLLWIGAALLEWRLWTWGYTPGPGEITIMTVAWVPLFVALPVAMFVVTWKWLFRDLKVVRWSNNPLTTINERDVGLVKRLSIGNVRRVDSDARAFW